MAHFEHELYKNPRRPDLNQLWWQLVSTYQMLCIPEGRADNGERPDWAAKIHLALYPAYYHNYLLGELTASQIQENLQREDGSDAWFGSPRTGDFLRTRMFELGATYPWDRTVEQVTGEPLSPDYFVRQFVSPGI